MQSNTATNWRNRRPELHGGKSKTEYSIQRRGDKNARRTNDMHGTLRINDVRTRYTKIICEVEQ